MLPLKKQSDLILPNNQETHLAEKSSRELATLMQAVKNTSVIKVTVITDSEKKTISVPLSAVKLLTEILTQMSEGNAVTLTSVHAELTTQEAADLLNVSRPYLVGLLDDNKIPHRKVGNRRKVLSKDILAYKKNIDQKRMNTLDKLVAKSQELDLGYE
ncbi:MAG: hypothetical protein A3F12_01735 [Gammaproteobacteria bacterium RIFCSPHIGHO2_12_FULL_38_14]|nr:MAG: hypothetical protein A3F12_01735 [Gammaproteobacteria bacterium RIFCSPHIGHO2_12_FULL_38_14]